jgi:hypothetical protein
VIAAAAAITCAAAGIAGCSGGGPAGPGPAGGGAVPATTWDTGQAPLVGIYMKGLPGSTAPVTEFARQTGVMPRIVLYFSSWGQPFQAGFASAVHADGATPLVQIESGYQSLPVIAGGAKDNYLRSFAQQVRHYGHPVIISFGHEMNGSWYQWGWKHTTAGAFIAAWRHIVTVFRGEGATNVTWMWTIQAAADAPSLTTNPTPWWPGGGYVDWVGIDGHYVYPGETFSSIFDPAISIVRGITDKPILIAETAISSNVGQVAKIPDLLGGVESRRLLGFVYFDRVGNHDYRLATTATLSAFTAAARQYGYAG